MARPIEAALAGWPAIEYMSFYQGSGVEPGRCVVETPVVSTSNLPRLTTLTYSTTYFNGTWNNMRLVKIRKIGKGKMRMVFEDERWKLRETTSGLSANIRRGHFEAGGYRATVAQGYEALLGASGLTNTVGTTPPFYPGMKFSGRPVSDALDELLHMTGCRMVYNPATSTWHVGMASSGTTPTFNNKMYRPAPTMDIGSVKAMTNSILYEDELTCYAVQINEDGSIGSLQQSNLDTDPYATHAQTAFRLWRVDGAGSSKWVYRGRGKVALMDQTNYVHVGAYIIRDQWPGFPTHKPLQQFEPYIRNEFSNTHQGSIWVADHPVLVNQGGSFKKTLTMRIAYKETNAIDTDGISATSTVGSGTRQVLLPQFWASPVLSDLSDMPSSSGVTAGWTNIMQQIADAEAGRYSTDPQIVELPSPRPLAGDPTIGAVHYQVRNSYNNPDTRTRMAINFDPKGQGGLY